MLQSSSEAEEREKNVRETLHTARLLKKRGGEGAPGVGAKVCLQPMTKAMTKIVPLCKMKNHVGADIHPAAHRGPHTRAGTVIFI